jgi:hypothetical protein
MVDRDLDAQIGLRVSEVEAWGLTVRNQPSGVIVFTMYSAGRRPEKAYAPLSSVLVDPTRVNPAGSARATAAADTPISPADPKACGARRYNSIAQPVRGGSPLSWSPLPFMSSNLYPDTLAP